jgi:hypothetical protein
MFTHGVKQSRYFGNALLLRIFNGNTIALTALIVYSQAKEGHVYFAATRFGLKL